ncbi:U3 small nucleolar RNA-associated protein 11 [Diplogelasinospora grovesii]|uniref:U3 small nucleolar RNA-associated protein 11 n=1 Tax=Diplogelasinospora grovesii TaxID=303347 RepID=A0AAN6NJZ4_9PEZI|nr:U3 small nucleolar RNA-associated protein 11 [Diplogelasinospora grovesii]
MSSLRNSVQRRNHKERAQPLERQRLGLLEKHKDYKKRSQDYNKKKATLRSLREKAADRNEDEFYFGMLSRKGPGSVLTQGRRWTGTVDGSRGNEAMDVETVRLLKTQDLGYLRTTRNVAAKEYKELEERFILAGGSQQSLDEEEQESEDEDDDFDDNEGSSSKSKQKQPRAAVPKKIVFFEGVQEREAATKQKKKKPAEDDDMEEEHVDDDKRKEEKRKQAYLERLAKRLRFARRKLRALTQAEQELEITQAKMAKTRTSGGITKAGRRVKVKERKR